MVRSLIFLSLVGAAIYALLVVTDNRMPVVSDGTKAEFVARQTRLSAWGPYLPDRSLDQDRLEQQVAPPRQKIASKQNAGTKSPTPMPDVPQTVTPSTQHGPIGKRLVSLEPSLNEVIWVVVSRAARLHAGPSVSSPTLHFYPVGTELKLIGYAPGWFHVLEPATSRTGWIYERYYLDAIPGPGQRRLVAQGSPPTRVALLASDPKPVKRIKQQRPKRKLAKPKRDQRIRLVSGRADQSVASIMERAFGRN